MRKVISLLTVLATAFFLSWLPGFARAESEAGAAPQTEAGTGAASEAVPAKGYVLVTTATGMGLLPLPEEEDYLFPITQTLPDGTVTENIVHLTPEGVYMESSDCENQDCVDEGTVTLENRNDRILGNMIICLPHQLVLQLYTPEEILSMLSQ